MTHQTYSKSRQQAEHAFSSIQTQFFARKDAVEELESVDSARHLKTLRLREARLARELADRVSMTSSLIAKRAKMR